MLTCKVRLQEAGRRRWGRRDHQALADARADFADAQLRLEKAVAAEGHLRERVVALEDHQQRRAQHVAAASPRRKEIDARLVQIDAALDRTRPDRVAALADDPPRHLVTRIGPAPQTPAGRAVWCHHALDIETVRDRNDGRSPAWTGWSPQTDRARYQVTIADRVLEASSDRPEPTEWAELAHQAAAIFEQVLRVERNRSATPRAAGPSLDPLRTPWIDPAAQGSQPGITL